VQSLYLQQEKEQACYEWPAEECPSRAFLASNAKGNGDAKKSYKEEHVVGKAGLLFCPYEGIRTNWIIASTAASTATASRCHIVGSRKVDYDWNCS
jgi:hypothetical protein